MSGWQPDGRFDLTITALGRWHEGTCVCTRNAITVAEVFDVVFARHFEPRGWKRLPHRSPNVLALKHRSFSDDAGSRGYGSVQAALARGVWR